MHRWKINFIAKEKIKEPILIEGLPGIGNVGKVAVDFIIDKLKAKKLCEIYSHKFPHSVFIDEKNMISLPKITVYYIKKNKNNFLLVSGDVQPIDEEGCYELSEILLNIAKKYRVKEIVTLGGIGLDESPKKPKVYCTGNTKKIIDFYKKNFNIKTNLYGSIGPIVGVTGLLVGMAKEKNIKAIALLAETYTHPLYLGIKGAREILKVLNKRFKLNIDLKELNKEIEEFEKEILKKAFEIEKLSKKTAIKKLKSKYKEEINYIG